MLRKDGQPKVRAPRNLPSFEHGFRANPASEQHRRPAPPAGAAAEHSVVSLFSGCGGMDLGFSGGFEVLGRRYEHLPFNVRYAADNHPDAVETYRLNLSDHIHDVDLTAAPLEDIPACDVLLGGFPCQDFSSSGPKVGLSGSRGGLYRVLAEYMAAHRPRVVVGENVPHLARLSGGKYLRTIVEDFEAQGYRFDVWQLYAPDYGLPQSRRRLFIVGVRDDIRGFPTVPSATHAHRHISIDEGLKDLEAVADETIANQSQFFLASRASSGGGQGDHTNQVGKVAYCIRANARGRIQYHYRLPRRLTVRECARLQSFPDEFVFPFTTQRNLTLIGNAVPPLLGHHVARQVAAFLERADGGQVVDQPRLVRPRQVELFDLARA